MNAIRATSDHRWLASLLLTLYVVFIGECAGICDINEASSETGRPASISTDTNIAPMDISALATRTFHKTEQFEINQVARTSSRSEFEQMKRQLIGNEATASSGDSVGMSGDTADGEGISIPGNATVIAWSDNRVYCLVRNDSDNTISLSTDNGTKLWTKEISLTRAFVSDAGNVVLARHQQLVSVMAVLEHLYFIDRNGIIRQELLPNDEYRFEGWGWKFCLSGRNFIFSAYPRMRPPNGPIPDITWIIVYDFDMNVFYKYEVEAIRADSLLETMNRFICFRTRDSQKNCILNVLDVDSMEFNTIQFADSTVLSPYYVYCFGRYITIERSRPWENRNMALFGIYEIAQREGD